MTDFMLLQLQRQYEPYGYVTHGDVRRWMDSPDDADFANDHSFSRREPRAVRAREAAARAAAESRGLRGGGVGWDCPVVWDALGYRGVVGPED